MCTFPTSETYESAFLALASMRGGPFRGIGSVHDHILDAMLARYRGWLRLMEDGAVERGGCMRVMVGYVANSSFNACANVIDGCDLIALHWSNHFRLATAFDALLTHGDIFPEFGTIDVTPVKGLNYMDVVHGAPMPPALHLAASPRRSALAAVLTQMAMDFIFFHEFMHLKHGHPNWLHSQAGTAAIDEFDMAGSVPFMQGERQTLEWDADCGAVLHVVHTYFNPEQYLDLAPMTTHESAIEKIAFALYICFRFFSAETFHRTLDEALARIHPPAHSRLAGMMAQVVTVLVERYDRHPAEASRAILRGAVQAEIAWSRTFDQEPVGFLEEPFRSRNSELLAHHSATWERLHDVLSPHTRFGNLPPPRPSYDWSRFG